MAFLFLLFHHDIFQAENPYQVFLRKKREILMMFFSGIFALALSYVFKLFFHTLRPFEAISGVNPLFSATDYAFPSGHAAFFTALSFSLFFNHRKIGYVFMFFAILISIARVIAGVHFPIDILGGMLLGFIISFLVAYFNKI